MNNSEKLKGYFQQYPFLQNRHFTNLLKIPNSTIKMFVSGRRNLSGKKVDVLLPFIEKLVTIFDEYKQNITKN